MNAYEKDVLEEIVLTLKDLAEYSPKNREDYSDLIVQILLLPAKFYVRDKHDG